MREPQTYREWQIVEAINRKARAIWRYPSDPQKIEDHMASAVRFVKSPTEEPFQTEYIAYLAKGGEPKIQALWKKVPHMDSFEELKKRGAAKQRTLQRDLNGY